MAFTQQTVREISFGGTYPADFIQGLIAKGYTNAQLAVALGTTVAEVARVLALPAGV